jgi:hypothetical protein
MSIRVHYYEQRDGVDVCRECGMVRNRDHHGPSWCSGRLPKVACRDDPGSPRRVALWDAINDLVVASGGSSSRVSVARMKAVARVEEALRAFTEVEGR